MTNNYIWKDNPTESGVAICDTDILNECLMHLKYNFHHMTIGTIIAAIRTDIPIGHLRLDGSEYTAGFETFVENYLATGKVINKSYAEWTTEYTMTNGCVSFFGYDEATEAFKTPVIPSGTFLAQAVQSGEFGSFLASSLKSHTHTANSAGNHTHTRGTMNITGEAQFAKRAGGDLIKSASGALVDAGITGDSGNQLGHNDNPYAAEKLSFNAANSWTGATSSNGNHTHTINAAGGDDTYPKHIKYPFFVVVANTNAEEASQADWDNFVGNLDTKANKSLNNLDSEGEKHFLNKSQITNCILEAPHMVDLELANGTLTLKAGSKVIVPYGTSAPTMAIGDSLNGGTIVDISWDESKLFYVVEYSEDISDTTIGNASNLNVLVNNAGQLISNGTNSSSADNTLSYNYETHYNTAANNVRCSTSSTSAYIDNCSLPIAFATRSDTGFTSIKQTFQHIGYVGISIWAMKGIKGLIPNGRNEDGTLNNIEFVSNNLITFTSNTNANRFGFQFDDNNNLILNHMNALNGWWYYDNQLNLIRDKSKTQEPRTTFIGLYQSDGTTFTTFVIPETFEALDANDTQFIAHQAMPSNRYIDLTLGTAGSQYTAPADGYFMLRKRASATGQPFEMVNHSAGILTSRIFSADSASVLGLYIPVSKGQTITVSYTSTNTTDQFFRFIYAQGV